MPKFVDSISSSYKELPPWAKGIIFIGALGAIYIFSSQTVSQIKKQASEKEANKSVNEAKDDLKALIKKGIKPSYGQSQYSGWSDAIISAFTGTDFFGKAYGQVEQIFLKLKNDADFLSLKTAFGIRDYDAWVFGNAKNLTLEAAIHDELDNGQVKALNNILEKNGITYKV